MKQNSRIQLENTLIGALGVLSLVLFYSQLPARAGTGKPRRYPSGNGAHGTACLFCRALHPDLPALETEARRLEHCCSPAVFKLFTRADRTFFAFASSVSTWQKPYYFCFSCVFGRTSAARLTGAASDALSCFCCWHWQASSSMPVSAIIFR